MRQQERPDHELPSFARYLNKVFDFRTAAGRSTDARRDPAISSSTVLLAAFHGFVFRLPSFQQLASEIAQPALQRCLFKRGGAAASKHYRIACGMKSEGGRAADAAARPRYHRDAVNGIGHR